MPYCSLVTTKGTSNSYRHSFQDMAKNRNGSIFCKGKWYLLVCDYYSKFPIFRLLPSISSKNVISALESIILEYGIVEEIICDNRKQFMPQEYKNFVEQYGFKLTTSSPYHPKGHGYIQRQTQTIKKNPHQMQVRWYQPHTWTCWNSGQHI